MKETFLFIKIKIKEKKLNTSMTNPKSSNLRTQNTFNHTTIQTIIYLIL